MIILGLNAYHGDSSACIVMDEKLIAAVIFRIQPARRTEVPHLQYSDVAD
jgi:predicted NodU family carbamoyl transferase